MAVIVWAASPALGAHPPPSIGPRPGRRGFQPRFSSPHACRQAPYLTDTTFEHPHKTKMGGSVLAEIRLLGHIPQGEVYNTGLFDIRNRKTGSNHPKSLQYL
ncbi:hypothetical protein BJ165DRAFT_1529287 [Panaeolus papilionaceus]|nr:hypothetical protein BJ165DRAFT_1529287 [Panaeolus papilionaceus]